MSTISSSKSGMSHDDHKGPKSLYDGDEDNPFRIPPDEKIFSFKEEEKERKIDEREKNKAMKIWEKNRPTREGCLRKICETDIEPSALAINPKVQKKINVGEAAGFTIPIERPKNKENRYKLIDKKREMFLVQQMLETKQKEIQRLEDHAFMREDGLNCSEKMLAQDTNSFISFFNDIKEKTQQANKEYEALKFKKAQRTQDLRVISDDQTMLVSSINKNIESLSICFEYKQFLDQLAPKEMQELLDRKKEAAKRRKEEQERREQLGSSQGKGLNGKGAGKDGKGTKPMNRAGGGTTNVRSEENEVQIPPKLRELIEDSDDDYQLFFNNPDELLEMFATLEEKNLFLIQQGQEAEQVLETKKHEFVKLQQEFNSEISVLKGGKHEIVDRISRTEVEKNNLQNTTQDEQNKVLDGQIYTKIDQQVKELFQLVVPEKAEGKMGNASVLQLLFDIEKNIDNFLNEFSISEKIDPNTVAAESTKIKKEQRLKNREEVKEKERVVNEEKQRKRQDEKEKKQFVKVGKPVMGRSDKPVVKRVKEVKKVLTDDQLDLKKYLEI